MSGYLCQRCKLPLVLDQSLEGLSNAQKHLLTVSYGQRPPIETSSLGLSSTANGTMKRKENADSSSNEYPIIAEDRKKIFKEALANGTKPLISSRNSESANIDDGSFVILEDKKQQYKEIDKIPMSERASTLQNIFNIISSKYEIDYPVCGDCANILIEELKKKFDQLSMEKDTYVQFLKKLVIQNGPNIAKAKESLTELDNLKNEENDLVSQLEASEKESEELTKELMEMEQEMKILNDTEKQLCDQKNKYDLETLSQLNELQRIQALYESDLNQLDALRKINVFNDIFAISHDGQFGTINGLRLGSLDDIKVSWHEINAALGQVVLLVSTVVTLLGIELDGYRLIPMGSTSKIEKIEKDPRNPEKINKTMLNVFSTGEFSLGRLFTSNSLDSGMTALVDVLLQIGNCLKAIDSVNDLPYKMTKDKVAGYIIKPSCRSSNEDWTAACRYMLTNANWILTYCIAHCT